MNFKVYSFAKNQNEEDKKIIINDENVLFHNTKLIIDNIDKYKNIVCVGEVQSGKTSNYLNFIEKALELKKYNIVIIFGGTTNSLYEQTQERIVKKFNNRVYSLQSKDNLKLTTNFDNVIININKNSTIINNLIKLIKKTNYKNKSVLIIDDESDFGTVNILKGSEIRSLSSSIENLYNLFPKGNFLLVTATPFANIVNTKSIRGIKPDVAINFYSNSNYCGVDYFNNSECYELVDATKKDYYKDAIKKTINYFIVDALKNDFDNENKLINLEFKNECLINLSNDNFNQNNYHRIIKNYFEIIFNQKRKFYEVEKINKWLEYKDFLERMKLFEKNYVVSIMNQQYKSSAVQKFNVIVGGYQLSRGNTFKYLICELILNVSETNITIDSLLQRARWFGYRKDYIERIKIFMNQEIKNAYSDAKKFNDIFHRGFTVDVDKLRKKITDVERETNLKGTSYEKY